MKRIFRVQGLIILILFICSQGLIAQQVIATSGSTLSNSAGSISFTIGECVAQTLTNGDITLTQGFHQSTLSFSSVSELKDLDFSISAFPNPTSNGLTLKLIKGYRMGLQYLLFDINGKLISQKDLKYTETKVPMEQLPAGLYVIKVQTGTKELKTFKIIKK